MTALTAGTQVVDTDRMWRLTMEHSPVGMLVIAPTGEVLAANTVVCDMLGHEPDVLTSMTAQDITHPDDVEADRKLAMEVLAGTTDSFRVTKRYLRFDGSVMVAELSLALLRDDRGDPVHFISQIVDLSERRAFEARLESAERQIEVERRRAEAVFETVAVGLLLLDADGNHQLRNARHRELLDLAFPDGPTGRPARTASSSMPSRRGGSPSRRCRRCGQRPARSSRTCSSGSATSRRHVARCRSRPGRCATASVASPAPPWPATT